MGKIRLEINGLKCERCSHEWKPNKEDPTVCPKCKSPYWNIPKRGVENENK